MEYAIIGGDARFAHLARLLSERGLSVGAWGRESQPGVQPMDFSGLCRAKNLIVNCPPKLAVGELNLEQLLATVGKDARVFTCGPKHPEILDDRLIDLWADEVLIGENAALTAEGAVASAMRASSKALRDAHCLVVGWGRIGRSMTEILVAMGAMMTVASRSASKRNRAVERGATSIPTDEISEVLPGIDIVFNTAPGLVLDQAALGHAPADALLIDLASPPYGIDLHGAWALGLRAWREPGLPGRYCPRSTAIALFAAIERQGL